MSKIVQLQYYFFIVGTIEIDTENGTHEEAEKKFSAMDSKEILYKSDFYQRSDEGFDYTNYEEI